MGNDFRPRLRHLLRHIRFQRVQSGDTSDSAGVQRLRRSHGPRHGVVRARLCLRSRGCLRSVTTAASADCCQIIWGPASELYGRKMPLIVGFVIFGIFQVPVAVAQNVETIFVSRFLSGFFGCAPLTIVGGALADFWAPVDRGVAVSIFSGATFVRVMSTPCNRTLVG